MCPSLPAWGRTPGCSSSAGQLAEDDCQRLTWPALLRTRARCCASDSRPEEVPRQDAAPRQSRWQRRSIWPTSSARQAGHKDGAAAHAPGLRSPVSSAKLSTAGAACPCRSGHDCCSRSAGGQPAPLSPAWRPAQARPAPHTTGGLKLKQSAGTASAHRSTLLQYRRRGCHRTGCRNLAWVPSWLLTGALIKACLLQQAALLPGQQLGQRGGRAGRCVACRGHGCRRLSSCPWLRLVVPSTVVPLVRPVAWRLLACAQHSWELCRLACLWCLLQAAPGRHARATSASKVWHGRALPAPRWQSSLCKRPARTAVPAVYGLQEPAHILGAASRLPEAASTRSAVELVPSRAMLLTRLKCFSSSAARTLYRALRWARSAQRPGPVQRQLWRHLPTPCRGCGQQGCMASPGPASRLLLRACVRVGHPLLRDHLCLWSDGTRSGPAGAKVDAHGQVLSCSRSWPVQGVYSLLYEAAVAAGLASAGLARLRATSQQHALQQQLALPAHSPLRCLWQEDLQQGARLQGHLLEGRLCPDLPTLFGAQTHAGLLQQQPVPLSFPLSRGLGSFVH